MKTCGKCKVEKDRSEFAKDKRNKSTGLQYKCKECQKSYRQTNRDQILSWKKAHYQSNRERLKAESRGYYAKNADKIRAQTKKYRQENYESFRARAKIYHQNNPEKMASRNAKRRANKLQATPPWLNVAHHVEIEEMYRYHQIFKAVMPERLGWHVDHIEPLQGENVRGLHVPWNLQVLPARENLAKSNHVSMTGE